MKLKTEGLSFKQSLVIVISMLVWLVVLISTLKILPNHSAIYPTVWIFSSSILFLVWLTQRSTLFWLKALNLNTISLTWLTVALVFGAVYWQLDQWLMQWLLPADSGLNEMLNWQQNTAHFYAVSLLMSSVFLAPIFEELFFRGLLLNSIKMKTNGLISISISALLFALIHWSWPEFISLFWVGIMYGWMTLKTKSVLPALIAHITHNALTFWLYVAA